MRCLNFCSIVWHRMEKSESRKSVDSPMDALSASMLGGARCAINVNPYACEREWKILGKVRVPAAVWHARIIAIMAGAEAEMVLLGTTNGGDGTDRCKIARWARTEAWFWARTEPWCWARTEARLRA